MWRPLRSLAAIGCAAAITTWLVPATAAERPTAAPRRAALLSLTASPATIELVGPRARARVLVTALFADGSQQDVSDQTTRRIADPGALRMDADGTLHALKDGVTTLRLSYDGRSTTAMITARGARLQTPISFDNEVEPILTRMGCNQGACHGAQYGKGGFKLSLAAFDPDLDYTNIVKQARGRRIDAMTPERSLLLLKPTMSVRHGGGLRLPLDSAAYRTLAAWLREGSPGPVDADPTVTRLEVFPSERIMRTGDAPQRLVVRAVYSDHTTRDVTPQTRLDTLNDAIAACTPDGVVRPVGRGQTAIMVRYAGLATVATFIVPFSAPGPTPAIPASGADGRNAHAVIDALVTRKQRQLGLEPSPLCDDRTFARRVFFDLIGTAPTPEEIAAFLADPSSDRRAKLIDRLLTRPEYADYWALKWGDLLRCNRTSLGNPKGMWSFAHWIHDQMQQNRPADQFARDLILAQGSTFTNGPANYYRVAQNPPDLAETTSQVFLGVRMQCARCHHHPFEKWSQTDYYQFAAFFARVGLKESKEFGQFGSEQIVYTRDDGEVNHPKTGAVMRPTPLGVQLASLPGGSQPDPDRDGDRRRALADWIEGSGGHLLARNLANRYWGYLFSKGIVNPIDDQRVTNPPTDPALLDFLTDELVRSKFDLKRLLRTLCNTQTYQRSSQATRSNRKDDLFFTHYLPRRLPAETLLDAIDYACGTREKYNELPLGVRAIQLPDPNVGSDFLDVFGRPQRLIACECERTAEPNLSQTLELMNGNRINDKVTGGNNRIAKLITADSTDDSVINTLYLTTLGRPPMPRERDQILGALIFAPDRRPVYEDVMLTLLNSKEFLFNH